MRCYSGLGVVAARGDEPEDAGEHADRGDAHPHRRVAVGIADLRGRGTASAPSRPTRCRRTRPCRRRGCPPARARRRPPATSAPTASRRSTKRAITRAITSAEPLTFRSRNGTPISGIAIPSFIEAGTRAVQRVRRSWKSVTASGLRIIKAPQAAGARWCVVVTEIGSSVSVATYVIVANTEATMKSRNGESRMITRERAALRRPRRRVRPAARDVPAARSPKPTSREHERAEPEVLPVAADQQQATERRADRDAEVRGDPDRRVRRLVALGRDQVGDHRLVGGAAERAEHRQEREQRRGRP